MKKIITICAALLMTASVFAQSPEKMSYQAVVRNGSNNIVASTSIGMQISILQGSASGTAVYVETQTTTSNVNGLVSLEIGDGTVVSGDFSTIDWENGPYFIQTETDPTGGTSYTITGTSQLLSVPYALHAKNSDSWNVELDTTFTTKWVGIGTNSPNSKLDLNNGYLSFSGLGSQQGIVSNISPFGSLKFYCGPNTGNASNGFFFRESSILGDVGSFNNLLRIYPHPVDVVRVGIGINNAQRQLHINDAMRLEPRATAPANPAKGDIYMDDTTNKLRVYDGTQWQDCW